VIYNVHVVSDMHIYAYIYIYSIVEILEFSEKHKTIAKEDQFNFTIFHIRLWAFHHTYDRYIVVHLAAGYFKLSNILTIMINEFGTTW
jgi:hypothetical protein